MRVTEDIKKQVRRELARLGGLARARKYDKKTLSRWASKGGRPKKKEGAR